MTEQSLPWWRWWGGPSDTTRETTGGDGDGQGPVCIGTVEGRMRAEIARSFLESEGFSVFLQGEAVAEIYGLPGGALAQVRIYVPAAQAEDAQEAFGMLDLA